MNRLKQLRLEKKISQVKLAIDLNTTQASICKYELEKSVPDINMLINLAKYFNVTIDYILELTPFRNQTENIDLSKGEEKCLSIFNSLTAEQKMKAIAYMTGLKDNKWDNQNSKRVDILESEVE